MIRLLLMFALAGFTTLPLASNEQVSLPLDPLDPSKELYISLKMNHSNTPNEEVFGLAYTGWVKLREEIASPIMTIIDFSLPSTQRRMWIIDMENAEILQHTVVSHGRNSGNLTPKTFSNRPESYKSSLGFYMTAETYYGKHGYSLKLDGLEEDFNDQARNRAIVIHGSQYAREEFARRTGRLGRSLGCPAIPKEISKEVIDTIKEGSLIFAFAENEEYLKGSRILNS